MTNSPEYIIGGTRVEVGQVWELTNCAQIIILKILPSGTIHGAFIGIYNHQGNWRSDGEDERKNGKDLIRCVGHVVPLEEAKEPQPAQSEPEQPKKLKLSAEYCHKEIMRIAGEIQRMNKARTVEWVDAVGAAVCVFVDVNKAMNNNPELMEYLA